MVAGGGKGEGGGMGGGRARGARGGRGRREGEGGGGNIEAAGILEKKKYRGEVLGVRGNDLQVQRARVLVRETQFSIAQRKSTDDSVDWRIEERGCDLCGDFGR